MKISEMVFECLRFELLGRPLSDELKSTLYTEIPQKLYRFSKNQEVAHLVADALIRNGLLEKGTEEYARFINERNMAFYRHEQMKCVLSEISKLFCDEKIFHIPLKKPVLYKYYPEPWMRLSCDLDILVKPEQLPIAIECLKKNLNYKVDTKGECDVGLMSLGGFQVELHFSLVGAEAKEKERQILSNVWETAIPQNDYLYLLDDKTNFCYTISHIAKHLKAGGCGIKPLIDVWMLNNKSNGDKQARYDLVEKAGLLTVCKAVEKLSRVWLLDEEPDSLCEGLEHYLLAGGVYGSFENKVAVQQTKKRSKFVYFLLRIFLPYRLMILEYPRLKKYPILYPFYIVKRWFRLFLKSHRERVFTEVAQTFNDRERGKQVKKIFKELDLI